MRYFLFQLLFWMSLQGFSQVNTQIRFQSEDRLYYLWNEEKQEYSLQETEYEHSIIEIREIGSKTNGYIIVTLHDNGRVRLYHGSIVDFYTNEEKESIWVIRSKNTKGKLMYNEAKKTFWFSFESNEKRYLKIFEFHLTSSNNEASN